jgi:hypothetical protein
MDGRFEIIDAFVDGERVDPPALKRALAEPEGRDYLIDAWLLREGVQDEIAVEARMTPPAPTLRRSGWRVAAVAAGVCLVGGYIAGFEFARARESRAVQPAPVAVDAAPAPPPSSFPVPPATRVIRLELETNWKESGGGG